MDNSDLSQERLIEELTLNRLTRPGESPQAGGYGGSNAIHSTWTWKVNSVDYVYLNDKDELHRIYGPAYVSRKYKMVKWYKEGKLHRVGGPALQHKSTFHWYYEGILHNYEGPAVVDPAGPPQYWIHGARLTEKQYLWEIKRLKKKGVIK
jgi:hypothetical protein